MNAIPITATNRDEFYYIRFSPHALEWLYILTKLLNSVEIKSWNDYILSVHEDSGDHVYMLKKERYNAASIAKALGISVERFLQLDVVVLEEPAQNRGLPKPNVNYWGTA